MELSESLTKECSCCAVAGNNCVTGISAYAYSRTGVGGGTTSAEARAAADASYDAASFILAGLPGAISSYSTGCEEEDEDTYAASRSTVLIMLPPGLDTGYYRIDWQIEEGASGAYEITDSGSIVLEWQSGIALGDETLVGTFDFPFINFPGAPECDTVYTRESFLTIVYEGCEPP